MKKAELLNKLKAARADLEAQLNSLTDDQLIHRIAPDSLSIKDLVAHITFWEQTMATNLRKIARGEHTHHISGDVDSINEQVFAANLTRPPGLIKAEFQRTHAELLEALNQLTDDDLNDDHRFDFRDDKPLWEYIWGESGEHYGDHNGDLYVMIQRVKSGMAR
jgi:hypothetical protein